jgi:hypothetical protein
MHAERRSSERSGRFPTTFDAEMPGLTLLRAWQFRYRNLLWQCADCRCMANTFTTQQMLFDVESDAIDLEIKALVSAQRQLLSA